MQAVSQCCVRYYHSEAFNGVLIWWKKVLGAGIFYLTWTNCVLATQTSD